MRNSLRGTGPKKIPTRGNGERRTARTFGARSDRRLRTKKDVYKRQAIIRPAQTVARFFLPPSPRGPGKRRAAGVELRSGFFGTHTPYGSATSRPRATTAMPLSRFTASFVTQA